MKIKAFFLASLLALFGSACAENDPTADTDIDSAELEEGSFTLTGVVLDAKAGPSPRAGSPARKPTMQTPPRVPRR